MSPDKVCFFGNQPFHEETMMSLANVLGINLLNDSHSQALSPQHCY